MNLIRVMLATVATIAPMAAGLADTVPPPPDPNWTVRERDAKEGKYKISVLETEVSGKRGTYRFQIVCVGINWPTLAARFPLEIAQLNAPVWVTLSIDQGPGEQILFRSSKNDANSIYLQSERTPALIERLAGGQTASVTASTNEGEAITFSFDAASLKAAVAPLHEQCKLPN